MFSPYHGGPVQHYEPDPDQPPAKGNATLGTALRRASYSCMHSETLRLRVESLLREHYSARPARAWKRSPLVQHCLRAVRAAYDLYNARASIDAVGAALPEEAAWIAVRCCSDVEAVPGEAAGKLAAMSMPHVLEGGVHYNPLTDEDMVELERALEAANAAAAAAGEERHAVHPGLADRPVRDPRRAGGWAAEEEQEEEQAGGLFAGQVRIWMEDNAARLQDIQELIQAHESSI